MSLLSPCIRAIGPADAKIAIVGEAPGEQEELVGIPFVGYSGQELDRMLDEVGIKRSECYLTNVLFTRPPRNNLDAFLIPRKDLPSGYPLKAYKPGKYLHPDLLPELDRLAMELERLRPNIIILLGNTACWAVLGSSGISKIRGTISPSRFGKCLPTYHPAAIMRDWSLRVVTVFDLLKARRESDTPHITRPERWITINPTLEEALSWCDAALSASLLSVDVETRSGSITCLGMSMSSSEAISIPFVAPRKLLEKSTPDRRVGSYWSISDEITIRKKINQVLSSPVEKVTQNGLYDIQYLLKEGYRLCNFLHDTMIQHHSLYPELPKSLGFLGSVYTNEMSWKILRPRGDEQLKRED